MPTEKPRLSVTLDQADYDLLVAKAQKHGISPAQLLGAVAHAWLPHGAGKGPAMSLNWALADLGLAKQGQ